MTISDAVSSSLGTLIGEFGPEYFQIGINNNAPLIGKGALKKVNPDGEEYVVTIYPGANHSTGFVLDGGRLPVGGSGLPKKARAMPAILVSVLSQGRAAAKLKLSDGRRTEMLDAEMKARAADCGRLMNRSLIGGSISPNAGTTFDSINANGVATVEFLDVSLFRENMAVDFIDVSSSKSYVLRVQVVTPAAAGSNSANVAGTVKFINDVPSPTTGAAVALTDVNVATGDSFRPRGYAAGFGGASASLSTLPNSFDDIAGSGATSTLMGIDPSTSTEYNWKGNYRNWGAAYSQEAALAFHSHIATRSDVVPDVVVCHPQTAAAHRMSGDFHGALFGVTAGISAGFQQGLERSADKYGSIIDDDLRLANARVIQDPSCQPGRQIMFNSEKTKLCEWYPLGPDKEAGDPNLLGRTYYTNEVQFSGGFNLVTDQRSSVGILDGFTGH